MVSEWSTLVPGSKELTTGRGSAVKSTDDTPETWGMIWNGDIFYHVKHSKTLDTSLTPPYNHSQINIFVAINYKLAYVVTIGSHWRILGEGVGTRPPPPGGSKFFHFHAVFGKKV